MVIYLIFITLVLAKTQKNKKRFLELCIMHYHAPCDKYQFSPISCTPAYPLVTRYSSRFVGIGGNLAVYHFGYLQTSCLLRLLHSSMERRYAKVMAMMCEAGEEADPCDAATLA